MRRLLESLAGDTVTVMLVGGIVSLACLWALLALVNNI